MNIKVKSLIKNFSFSFTANLVGSVLSALLVLIVPKFLGSGEYSYWQLYVFYSSYVGFFHFGLADGIYLRYGGKEYEELDKGLFHFQFWMLTFFEIIVGAVVSLLAVIFAPDEGKKTVLVFTAACLVLMIPRTMLQYVLQGSNHIKEYARNLIIEKIIYAALVFIALACGFRKYQYLLGADLVAKAVTLFTMCLCCKEIVIQKTVSFATGIKEALANINVGIKLMFANIAGMLIIGIVRYSISQVWDVQTFGKVSLSMSISNMMMLFISAVSIVLFPLLKRTPKEKWAANYSIMRGLLVIPILGLLVLYYPAKVVMSAWLPKYQEALRYMALMFPICLYEGKMSLLVNTYMKAMRMEKTLLFVNLASLGVSAVTAGVVIWTFKNLDLSVVLILILLAFRCILAEGILTRKLSIKNVKNSVLEVVMTTIFVCCNWFIQNWRCMAVYLVAYVVYLFIRRKEIATMKNTLKPLLKS